MRPLTLIALPLVLSACNDKPSEAEVAAETAKAVESVERANNQAPLLIEVVPEAIEFSDIETHDLFGQSCNYSPGTGPSVRVIAREADAFMKVDGEILRFAADPGSRELPMRSRSLYNGLEYSLRLAVEGEGVDLGEEAESTQYEGTVWLRDRWDRVVYTGTGQANCGV